MPSLPNTDDAIAFFVDFARSPRRDGYPSYGYELWLPNIVVAYMREVERETSHEPHNSPRAEALSPVFYDAGWELCRRGILRPGLEHLHGQATSDGASGNGYSVSQAGRQWLASAGAAVTVVQGGRLSQLFVTLAQRLGPGFLQRAQEAASCHWSGAYLACCAMCGAAAESILLAVAIARTNDEATVLGQYRSAGGRRKVIDGIVGGLRAAIADPFRSATGLLGYWRDEAAHGTASSISEIEAHDALARLLRFAQFTNDNWNELTR